MNKKELIKKHEYETKLLMLRIKYSKNIFETLALSMSVVMGTLQLRIQLAQPIPNYIKGGVVPSGGIAIISSGNRPEFVERKK